jgi:hypothetical protein
MTRNDTTTSTTLPTSGARKLIERVYTIAKTEARDAHARRGLPYGGLFCSADPSTFSAQQQSARA